MHSPNPINQASLDLLSKAAPDAFEPYERRFLKDMTNPNMQAITQRQSDFMQSLAQKVGYTFEHTLPIAPRQVNGARQQLGTLSGCMPRTPSGY